MPLAPRHKSLARSLAVGAVAALALPAVAAPALIQSEIDAEAAPLSAPARQYDVQSDLTNARLRSGVYPAQPVPPEFAVPSQTVNETAPLDWSVGLRGTYANSDGESSFVTHLTPQFTYTHAGGIADIVVNGSADIAKVNGQDLPTLAAGGLSISATAPIDSETSLSFDGGLGITQDLPGTVGLSPSVTTPPQVYTGNLDVGVDRQFGRLNLGLSGGVDRTVYGPTLRTDTGLTDNGEQNYWSANASLRVGYQITPIVEVFGQAALQRDMFDIPTASLGDYPNATNRTLRGGLAGKWNDIWSASASIGIGERVFDAASVGTIRAYLYGAELRYTPDPTLTLTAGGETELTPAGADNPGTARVRYTALANAQYTVNTWLRLRASAEWSHSDLVGTAATERGYGIGAGADYVFNAHTSLNADYGYGNYDNSTNGNTQTHRISLGVTISR